MPVDRQAVLARLRAFEFSELFTQELGWDWYTSPARITVGKLDITLQGVAEKRGVHVFLCPPGADGRIPDATQCAAIERQTAKVAREHLLIFTDAARTEQVWLYPRREPSKPIRLIRYRFNAANANELLLQKLAAITFTLNDEEGLNLLGVVERLKDTLDRDVVTKAFYQRFEKERAAFQEFLDGIPDENLERWYVAVMMNRLMFIYFIQEKGFLGGGNQRYLQEHLATGKGNYYRDFLCPLFFEGFACKERTPEILAKLGQVPYLNGGIFQKHEIEKAHGRTIKVPNEAFVRLFAFFDDWNWHLDDRPIATGKEINPEILGYIFEKFINQKQMGAYYTKEDITGYIGRNTIIPYILDAARAKCKVAFENTDGPTVWDYLRNDPDRYIYAAVRKGTDIPLPPEIEKSVDTEQPEQNGRRVTWNKPADNEYALCTEIWREVVARRQRCSELRCRLSTAPSGSIRSNDLITLNLDICQFAQDVIERCDGPDLLRALWHAISTITVLDPTCGSGAFLFAAVNILEPLYEACLDRMEDLLTAEVAQLDPAQRKTTQRGVPLLPHKKYEDFSLLLDRVASHASRPYFILKSIVLNNLYGVDIMEEAVEICKLRLFLKLVAQVDTFGQIEPLPDIDFNIRAGNTLVGFASRAHAKAQIDHEQSGQGKLQFTDAIQAIDEKCTTLENMLRRWRKLQETGKNSADEKSSYREGLETLRDELDTYLAQEYEINIRKPAALQKWKESHQPFHWFVEFHTIMTAGGFDVIIGNPPYISKAKIRKVYGLKNYRTDDCADIYANVLERVSTLLTPTGRTGMIIPLSLTFSGEFDSLRELLFSRYHANWFSSFARIPAALFSAEVRVRNTIHIGVAGDGERQQHSTVLHRWFEKARPHLFNNLRYAPFNPGPYKGLIPKIGMPALSAAYEKCFAATKKTVASFFSPSRTEHVLYFKKSAYNWLNFCRRLPPCFDEKGHRTEHTQFGTATFRDEDTRNLAFLFLNGKIMYIFWAAIADDFHVTEWMFANFPINFDAITQEQRRVLLPMASQLEELMETNTSFKLNAGKKVGNFNLAKCRTVTDVSDFVFASSLGIAAAWQDIELAYSQIVRTDFEDETESEV